MKGRIFAVRCEMRRIFVSLPLPPALKLHNFTAFQRKVMYEICGKKQLLTTYHTYFSDFSSSRNYFGLRWEDIGVIDLGIGNISGKLSWSRCRLMKHLVVGANIDPNYTVQ